MVAIASDYDLSTPSGYKAAEKTLHGISKDVALEEATGFNPTGTSGIDDVHHADDDEAARSTSATSASHQASHAHPTDTSSTDHSSLPADSSESSMPSLTSFNNDSEENKFLQLRSMFSDLKDFDITHSLKKANGDFQTALDDLLHIQYLMSTGQHKRGIDGFFQTDETPKTASVKKGRKGKGKTPAQSAATFDLDSTSKEVLEKNQAKALKRELSCSLRCVTPDILTLNLT